MLHDCQYAFRTFRHNATLAVVVVLSLAVGIGVNSAIFSIIDALLVRPLPYPHADRLAAIWTRVPEAGILRDWLTPDQYLEIRHENHSFDEMSIAGLRKFAIRGGSHAEQVDGMYTSAELLRMLGAKPLLGHLLVDDDENAATPPVAILSYRLWKRFFGADARILGRSVSLNSETYTVAGVLRPDFRLDSQVVPADLPIDKIDVFLQMSPQARGNNFNVIVRLKTGVSLSQAQADINVIARHIRDSNKLDRSFGLTVVGLREQMVGKRTPHVIRSARFGGPRASDRLRQRR